MALKPVLDKLDAVPTALRSHYVERDGAFHLALDGEHPDAARVGEFRDKNITLLKEVDALKADRARFDGIDPEAVKADRARLAELEKGHTDTPARVAALEAELAQERAARAVTEQAASRARVRDSLRPIALATGAIPAAVEMLLDKAEPLFTIVNDTVHAQPNTFSRARPGCALTPEDWLAEAVREFPFLFHPSTGGGAGASTGATTNGARELRDPSPHDLGRYADDIRSGAVRVVTSA